MSGRTRLRAVAAAVTVVLAASLTACTSDDAGPAGSAGSSTPTSVQRAGPTSATQGADTSPPAEEACYRLTVDQLARATNGNREIDCAGRHDAQTVHVGRLDLFVDGHALAVDSDRAREQQRTTCPKELAGYVGGSDEDRRLSRFEVVWFSPTLEASDAGADWFRCDVVAFAGGDALYQLPAPDHLRGVLDSPAGLDEFGLCGTAAPGADDFARVICGRPHAWRAIATIPIPGGDRYPGTGRARAAGDETCKDRARDQAEDPLTFRYGWEWPTADQWSNGQHYGFCWAPD